jgi:acylaminoacyl-peptidase
MFGSRRLKRPLWGAAIFGFSVICSPSVFAQSAKAISLEDYAKHAQFIDVKISPNGTYFAVSSRADDDKIRITVLERNGWKVVSQNHFPGQDTIASFEWVNDERLIFSLAREIGALEQPLLSGELYAVNADGKRQLMLTGYRSKEKANTVSEVVNYLPNDDKYVIISSRSLTSKEPFIEFFRLNVDTGRKIKVAQAPIRAIEGSNLSTVTDHEGIPRLVTGIDPKNDTDTVVMSNNDGEWQELYRFNEKTDQRWQPLAFTQDKKSVIALSNLTPANQDGEQASDTLAVVQMDLATKKQDVLARHPRTDVMPIISIDQGVVSEVIGASYEYDAIDSVFFDNAAQTRFGQSLQGLIAAFPGKSVAITSVTRDNKNAVVQVQSANHDASYYLLDMEKNKLTYLLNSRPWLKDVVMPETKLITYKARDGQTITALLTLPKGGDAKNLPLVLFPHGGPIGVRDSIGAYGSYQANIKVLAEHGYAVLQPNFRGSGGFGIKFQQQGYQQWGTLMIDDMTDGVRHLASQGIVDDARVCTFGASYGGYAAVQAAIRQPELYKCAIAYVGVFDLQSLFEDGDIPETEIGKRFIARTVGDSAAVQQAQSPLRNLDKLKAPVFIVHGAADRRTPLSYAMAFRKGLEQRNHPFEWMVKEKEGHGFYKPANNVELWQKSLQFLDKHIGVKNTAQ